MSLRKFAEQELSLIESDDDEYSKAIKNDVLELLDVFAKQGHSGFSASMVIGILTKLMKFQPLSPITGNDDEWMEIENNLYQNRRCSTVFKRDGEAYDINGYIFEDENGDRYTSSESKRPVVFPYVPTSIIVKKNAG